MKLGRAVQLASAAENQDKVEMLNKVVDVEDASTGRVRLRKQVRAEDEMTLDTRSTRTARGPATEEASPRRPGAVRSRRCRPSCSDH